ncbi:hypothetical protein BHC43_06060 [Snodgrassella alvi]|uniref:hypothetical protein n=1 Tax=Snodgrassella alvi TaxID=1196083 RepID=UPI000C1F92E2|nr:hypothetical protein [Snodgrassella alvi]PIT37447.1 hypothetical protein BHC43_06060 [Snodgrassella alvi]
MMHSLVLFFMCKCKTTASYGTQAVDVCKLKAMLWLQLFWLDSLQAYDGNSQYEAHYHPNDMKIV